MDSYRGLLKEPGVARIMTSQIVARFPSGMIALALLIHIQGIFGSYGAAGLVLAAISIGQGIAGPITSRLMGQLGARPVLIATTLVCAATLMLASLTWLPLWAYIVGGLIGGFSYPPVLPAVRTLYPKLVPPSRLPRLFSLDASAQEIIWVMGPLLITVVALEVSSVAGVLMCAVLLVVGGAWFIASPELGQVRFAPSSSKMGAVLKSGPVLLATGVGVLLIGGTSAIEAAVVARFGDGGLQPGVILGSVSLASLIAGLSFGHRRMGRLSLSLWISLLFLGPFLASFTEGFFPTLLVLLLAGASIAPALAVLNGLVSEAVDFSETAEAYGWVNTGQLVGAAIGSAVAGFLIDDFGASGGFLTAAVFGALGALVPLLFRRSAAEV